MPVGIGLFAALAVACGGGGPSSGRDPGEVPLLTPTPATVNCLNANYPADAPPFGDEASFEYRTLQSGVGVFDHEVGTGPRPESNSRVMVQYTGFFEDGCVFDTSRTRQTPASFQLSNLIQGWQIGMSDMQEGGKRRIRIPPALAYGAAGVNLPGFFIPANSTLVFEIELLDVEAP